MMDWKEIRKNEPPVNHLVVLTGPSGYRTYPNFLTLGYLDDSKRFRGVDHEGLSDNGWYPTHWALMVTLP